MDSRSSDKASQKGRLKPLSDHPAMDRLAEILQGLSLDRVRAFMKWNQEDPTHLRVISSPQEKDHVRGSQRDDQEAD